MPIVGYTIDDLSFGMPNGDFVDDGPSLGHAMHAFLLLCKP